MIARDTPKDNIYYGIPFFYTLYDLLGSMDYRFNVFILQCP